MTTDTVQRIESPTTGRRRETPAAWTRAERTILFTEAVGALRVEGIWLAGWPAGRSCAKAPLIDGVCLMEETRRRPSFSHWHDISPLLAWTLASASEPTDVIAHHHLSRHMLTAATSHSDPDIRASEWIRAGAHAACGVVAGQQQLSQGRVARLGLNDVAWAWLDCHEVLARSADALGHRGLARQLRVAVTAILCRKVPDGEL